MWYIISFWHAVGKLWTWTDVRQLSFQIKSGALSIRSCFTV